MQPKSVSVRATVREIVVQLGIGHSASQKMKRTLIPETLFLLGSLIAERQAQKGMHGCVTVASKIMTN
jgi:hypothetical protein